MRILVYPHDLAMGGSQINAIDIAAIMRDSGHEPVVYGKRGTLVGRLEDLGLEFIESPRPRRRPTPSIVASLRDLIRTRGIDVVHGYEWPPTLEAVVACRGSRAVAVSTVLSMSVAPFIPHYVPLMVGTEQILAAELTAGRHRVHLMEPPIDTRSNSPEAALPVGGFIHEWGLDPEAFTVVVVSRLAREMKLEGILTAIEAVRRIHGKRAIQLVIVGGGNASDQVEATARRVNAERGARAIVVTGELLDPRPAYAVADLTIGMGSSALRAMAFGKPLIVQGINGFWEPLTPTSLATFLWQGWYGEGNGPDGAADLLAGQIREVMDHPRQREAMAELSLRTVRNRFSLVAAADRQLEIYETALAQSRNGSSLLSTLPHDARSLAGFFTYSTRGLADRVRRREREEDFNSSAVLVQSRAKSNAWKARS